MATGHFHRRLLVRADAERQAISRRGRARRRAHHQGLRRACASSPIATSSACGPSATARRSACAPACARRRPSARRCSMSASTATSTSRCRNAPRRPSCRRRWRRVQGRPCFGGGYQFRRRAAWCGSTAARYIRAKQLAPGLRCADRVEPRRRQGGAGPREPPGDGRRLAHRRRRAVRDGAAVMLGLLDALKIGAGVVGRRLPHLVGPDRL